MSSDLQPVTIAGTTYHQRLARVQSFTLSNEDHGCLTLWLHLDYGGSCQGFGGYTLDTYSEAHKRRVGHACGTDMILRILTQMYHHAGRNWNNDVELTATASSTPEPL